MRTLFLPSVGFAALASTALAGVFGGGVFWACSAPNLKGQIFACTSNADCTPGLVCSPVNGVNGCIPTDQAGLDGGREGGDAGGPLQIGMTAAFSGVSGDLGTQVRRGIQAWFNAKNATGGVQGRNVVLVAKDDQYEPEPALSNTYSLLDIATPNPADYADGGPAPWQTAIAGSADRLGPNRVLSMIGCVGTPQMVRTAPVCIRDNVIFFAPYSGALTIIRDGTVSSPYVFNYRASYYDETAGMVAYLTTEANPRVTTFSHVIGFTQQDSFGDAGYNGFYTAWNTGVSPIGPTDIPRVQYTRNSPQTVAAAVTTTTTTYLQPIADTARGAADAGAGAVVTVGIFMIDTYGPGSTFVKGVLDWQNTVGHPERQLLNIIFMNVSFVGGDALLQDFVSLGSYTDVNNVNLKKYYGDGVWITQVVPYYKSQSQGVQDYRNDLKTVDALDPTWGSLEGFLDARLFTEGLDHTTAFDSTSMVKAFEAIRNLDVGIGIPLSFSSNFPSGHQASKTVWFSRISLSAANPVGSFAVPLLYGPGPNGTPTIQSN